MHKYRYVRLWTAFSLFAVTKQLCGQDRAREPETICYCKTRTQSPDNVAQLDNNLELLKELLIPQDANTLKNKVRYNDSQLELLRQWNLITLKDDKFETAVPYFDSSQVSLLREISYRSAIEIVRDITPDVNRLVQQLSVIKRSKNAYSILFSYVLDGKVWQQLEDKKMIAKRDLDEANHLWNGEFWILEGKRKFFCGTNVIRNNGYGLFVNWSHGVIRKMWDFFGNWPAFERLFADFEKHNKVINDTARTVFAKYNIFDSTGNLTIPVIKENKKDEMVSISNQVSTRVSEFLKMKINMYDLGAFGFRDSSQAVVILYHEILWDIMDILVQRGMISKPVFFADPDKATARDAADLIFLTTPQ